MITFLVSIGLLILGYLIYGRYLEKVFGANRKFQTPAYALQDGVDYIPMKTYKVFLIQFLNIAGLGPIFGAVLGAVYGPVAFLWIVFGNIFGGAMHDYFSGMLSVRHQGMSLPQIIGKYLGKFAQHITVLFTIVLMILVGVVFVLGPASIISSLSAEVTWLNTEFWIVAIFVYYLVATIMPIDKIIGKLYPIFGFALLIMAVGILASLLLGWMEVPELTSASFRNMRQDADEYPLFPLMFTTIACGAVSGFHATQSPMMARCMKNEAHGRVIFYGAMITEGVVALIWAAAGMAFFGGVEALQDYLTAHGNSAALVVKEISQELLGSVGGLLVLIGVVCAPITTGDTAMRSARLILADSFHFSQKTIKSRLLLSIPLFLLVMLLTQIDFAIIWRYFAWSNQALACITLWAITIYLAQQRKPLIISLIPALFMSFIVILYILVSPDGLHLEYTTGVQVGLLLCAVLPVWVYLYQLKKKKLYV